MKFTNNSGKDFLILDIYDVFIKSKETGEVLAMQRLTQVDLSMTSSSQEIRGGKGNALIMNINSDKKLQVTLTQPTFSYQNLAMSMGTSIITKQGEKYIVEDLTVAAGKVSVKYTPVTDSVKAYDETGKPCTVTVASKDITITSPPTNGAKVRVVYKTQLSVSCECLEISAKTFPKAVELTLQSVIVDNQENDCGDVIIDLPLSKPSADWSLGKSSERNAGEQQMVFDIQADASGKLGYMYFDEITETE